MCHIQGVVAQEALYTILRSPNGNRYVVYFYWNDDTRKWNWNYNRLDNHFNANNPSAVSPQLFSFLLCFGRGVLFIPSLFN